MPSLLRTSWLSLVVLIASSVFALCAPKPEYDRLKLFELAGRADVVVVGTIDVVRDTTFRLRVDETIAGSVAGEALEARRFVNWTCAHRWAHYRVGQRVVLFASRLLQGAQTAEILGAGGEGEMPLVGSDVIVRGYEVHGVAVGTHQVDENERASGGRMPLAEFSAAIRGYRELFEESSAGGNGRGWTFRLGVGADHVSRFIETSPLARHLVEETLSDETWRGSEPVIRESVVEGSLPCIRPVEHGFAGPSRLPPGRKPDRFGFAFQSEFGSSAAFLGDVDGDGIGDLAVGADHDSYVGHFHGVVWILFLDADGRVRNAKEIREQQNGLHADLNEFAQFGCALAPLGDIDRDGVPDLAIGAQGWDGGGHYRGGVWICCLASDGSVRSAVELGSQALLKKETWAQEFGLGRSLALLGDLDLDGTCEIAIGQYPMTDTTNFDVERSVLVVSIADNAEVRRVQRIHCDGCEKGFSWFGDSLASLGDLDGDGIGDLAIGSPFDDDGGDLRGAVWIAFLNADASVKSRQKISDWSGGFDGLLRDEAKLGSSLAAPGDLDGDGIVDLLVGSSGSVWVLFMNRDGTVRSHREIAQGVGGFSDVGRLGNSIAIARHGTEELRFAALGGNGPGRADPRVWLVPLDRTGGVASR